MDILGLAVLVAVMGAAAGESTSGLDMNPAWYPAIVGGLVSALSAAAIWGSTRQSVKALEERAAKLEKSDDKQWGEINDLGQRVTWVEAKANGKGAGR